MSIEAAATLAAPIIERPVACVSDASARHLRYLTRFKDNYESLRSQMSILVALKEDVNRRNEVGEANQQMERRRVVAQWLQKAEAFRDEVDPILQKCSDEVEQRCCANYCPKNWWARYKLGKKVWKKLITVADLISQGNFDTVVDRSRPSQVQVQPESRTIGLDASFEEVWSWIGDDKTKIIGIYGMGGVGKTTLLKKINNKFEREVSSFDLVLWVVVSSKFSVLNVQKQIMERLGLTLSDDRNIQAQCIFNALSKKNFLLLLDDIWEGLDLEAVGIPSPYTSRNISKVVFTTRSERVCGSMEANKKFKVTVLEWEQAWELFQQKVGEDSQDTFERHPEIPELAKAVAKECGGLPLALITTGKAMSTKKTPREWNHDLEKLKRYASQFEDMEAKVFSILKFSYDSLDPTARECFLYCSLYPEDYYIDIEHIIHQWIGEGFFDEFKEFDMAKGQGYAVIGTLKSACLLEMGALEEYHVKLHDVVRDLALWIANECGEYRNKYLVQAGVGLSQAPNIEDWEGKERISLVNNDFKELIGAPNCPGLVTLMFQWNSINYRGLSVISGEFFQYMPNLKVLDLQGVNIKYLPNSIGCLLELRYLNLRRTEIKTLPDELGTLVKLTYLDLAGTKSMSNIPNGILSCLSSLQVLFLGPFLCWDDQIEAELETLYQLDLYIRKLPAPQGLRFSQRSQSCLESLLFTKCSELTELALMSSTHLGKTKKLRDLQLCKCDHLQKLSINSLEADKDDMGPLLTLEMLHLSHLPKLSNIIWEETTTHLHFKLLKKVRISRCPKLRDISWLVLIPFLKVLSVSDCEELEEIILDKFAAVTIEDQTSLSRLVKMELWQLPELKSIVKAPLSFPSSLQSITVLGCPLLKKLPFSSNNSTLKKIEGEAKWWDELEWEDQTIKTSLQPSFIPFERY